MRDQKTKMEKRIIIIHGWEGSPQGDWFPWLRGQLEQFGYEVIVPAMPNPNFPVMQKWLAKLGTIVGDPDENVYLVGHSLGVIAILRYLESLNQSEKIGGAVLVAGFPEPIGYKELNSFFQKPLDYEKIKKTAKKFVAVHSDNDPYVPMRNGELLRDKLGAELLIIKEGGHLNAENGYTELPIVLDILKKMLEK